MNTHNDTLDGLRGTAAISVFLFHVIELIVPSPAGNPFRHAYLAVDFFFALSGYVIGLAYDGRMSDVLHAPERLSVKGFLRRRLVRLHPLVVISMCLGFAFYVFDPYMLAEQREVLKSGLFLLTLNLVLALCLLPAPPLPAAWNQTHSLNGPSWSLFQEYLVNLMYGLGGHRLPRWALAVVAAVAAATLYLCAIEAGNLTQGWSWDGVWVGFSRVFTSFTAGLLIHRLGLSVKVPFAWPILSACLVAVFTAPIFEGWNGLFDWMVVVLIWPLVLIAGAGRTALPGPLRTLCRMAGRLSYPLYILHYPFLFLFAHWCWSKSRSAQETWAAAGFVAVVVPAFAWCVLVFIDEPLRKKLSKRAQVGPTSGKD